LKRITILLVAAVGVLAMSAGLAVAQEQPTRTTVTVLPFDIVNPCTEETDLITFSGTAEQLLRLGTDQVGGRHNLRIVFSDVVGTDASGQQYRLEEVNVSPSLNNPQGPQREQTQSSTFRVYSVDGGAAPEFVVHTTIHLTTNANGELIAEVRDINAECPGTGTVPVEEL
jgi:hypothetical protein